MADETSEPPAADEPASSESQAPGGGTLRQIREAALRNAAAFNLLANSTGVRAMTESFAHLNDIINRPALATPVFTVSPRPEIGLLQEVHTELEGMAELLGQSAQQTAAMAEVTKANLIAVQAVVGELQKGRESSDRWSRALIWLTVAIFAATTVGAIALLPEFARQLAAAWSRLQSLH